MSEPATPPEPTRPAVWPFKNYPDRVAHEVPYSEPPLPTLYEDLVAANQEISNWQSDLYVPATEEAKAIFRKHGQKLLYFKSNINGKFMLEAPFQFDPFWERRGM